MKEKLVKIRTIEIPTDLNDVADLKIYNKAVAEIKKLENKVQLLASKIVFDCFIKTAKEVVNYFSDDDLEIVLKNMGVKPYYDDDKNKSLRKIFEEEYFEDNQRFLVDTKNKKIFPFFHYRSGWTMGDSTGYDFSYNFHDAKMSKISITVEWQTKSARFNHIPWVHHKSVIILNTSNYSVVSWESK